MRARQWGEADYSSPLVGEGDSAKLIGVRGHLGNVEAEGNRAAPLPTRPAPFQQPQFRQVQGLQRQPPDLQVQADLAFSIFVIVFLLDVCLVAKRPLASVPWYGVKR